MLRAIVITVMLVLGWFALVALMCCVIGDE